MFFGNLEPKQNDNAQLTRNDYNALVQGAQRQTYGNSGFSDGDTNFGAYEKSFPVPFDIVGKSTIAIPIYSICTLKLNPGNTNVFEPFRIGIQACKKINPRPLLFTNSDSECVANGTCVVHPIAHLYPVLLKSAAGEVPEVGAPCGPADDDFYVSKYGMGMTCLAVDAVNFYVMAYLDMPGRRWLVKPEADIPANTGGRANVWNGEPGEETLSSPLIFFDAWNRTGSTCQADKFAEVVEIDNRYIVPWECAEETNTPPVGPVVGTEGILDNFDRPTGQDIGSEYTHAGAGSIADYTIVARNGADHACRINASDSYVIRNTDIVSFTTLNYTVELEPFGLKSGDELGLVLSIFDSQNFYTVFGTKGANDYTLTINRYEAGVVTTLATSTIALPVGGTREWLVAKVDLVTNAILGWVRNENQVKSAILSAPFVANDGDRVGFGAGSMNGSNDVDNFKIDEQHNV